MRFKMKWILSISGLLLFGISVMQTTDIHPHSDPLGTNQTTKNLLDELYSTEPSIGSQQSIREIESDNTLENTLGTTEQTFTGVYANSKTDVGKIATTSSDLTNTFISKSLYDTTDVTLQHILEEQAQSKPVTTSHILESITSNYDIPNEPVKSTIDRKYTQSIINTFDQNVDRFKNTGEYSKGKTTEGENVADETTPAVAHLFVKSTELKDANDVTHKNSKITKAPVYGHTRNYNLTNATNSDLNYETQIFTELITRTQFVTTYITPTKSESTSKDDSKVQSVKQTSIDNAATSIPKQDSKLLPSNLSQTSNILEATRSSETFPPDMEATPIVTSPQTPVEYTYEQEATSVPWEDVTIMTPIEDFLKTTDGIKQLTQKELTTLINTDETHTTNEAPSLETVLTIDGYVTGITTEMYTSKEYAIVPNDFSSPVNVKKRTTIQEPDLHPTSALVTKSEFASVSDSAKLATSLETIPTTVNMQDTHVDETATDAYTIVTELQTVIETTVVPVGIVVLTPPRLLSISTLTAHSTKVFWRMPPRPIVKNFRVQYIGTFFDRKSTVVDVSGNANNVIIDGLTSGERYKFRVLAVPVRGTPSDWSNTLQADTVMVPVIVSVESVQERTLTLSWMDNPNVAIRETQITYSGTAEDRVLRTKTVLDSRRATLTELYPGDLYEVEVTATSHNNQQAVTKIQAGTRPFPPSLEPISYYNVSSIEIGVKPPTNSIVHSFNVSIQLQNRSEITYFHVLNLGSSVTNFVIPSLVSGGQYVINIACIGYGFHEYSRWTKIQHTAKLYAPMIQSNRIVITMNRITLYWTFRDYIDCSHFLVTYSAIHGGTIKTRKVNKTRKTIQLQSLVPGETYTVIVKAVSGPEFASSQPLNITTSLGRLNLEPITDYTSTSVTLSWVTSATNAIIEYFVISYEGAHLDVQPTSVNVSGVQRTYMLPGLTPGETYSISVQARSGRQKADSNLVSKTTIPYIPTDVDAPQTTTDTILLSWEQPANSVVETYEIKYYNMADNVVREGVSSTGGYVMKNLKPGAVYRISIRSVSRSEKSGEATTIQRTKLGKPSEVRVGDVTNTSFTILWKDPPGSYDDVIVKCDKCSTRELKVFPGMSVARFRKLSAGTQYRITLVTEKRGFENSFPAVIIVVTKPHTPEDLNLVSYSKTDISFSWVDRDCTSCFYRVRCVAFVDGVSFHDDLWHNSETSHHEYSCNSLVPGELYTISVTSLINIDLTYRPAPLVIKQRTEPAMPNNINIITRTSESVSLKWERAEGIFDYYTTKLVSPRHTIVANYTPEVTTIDKQNLDPYIGYDFYIRTVSGKLISETRHIHFNTREGRPGQVSLFKLMPVNPTKISVYFEEPLRLNGKILGYTIAYQGSNLQKKVTTLFPTNEHRDRKTVPYNTTEVIFSSLRPGYVYSFSIKAETTVGYGPELIRNISTPIWPPRATSIRPKGVNQEDITSKSFPVEFDDSYFSDDYGEILYYSVIVAEAAAIVYDQQPESFDRPNVTMTTWSQAIGQDPIPRYQISEPIRYSEIRNANGNTQYTGSLRIQRSKKGRIIMIGSESCSKRQHIYCNGPLSSGKTYVYNFRAYTEAGYTDTHFSSPVSLPEADGILIIAILCALILLLIVVIILVVIFLRRNKKYNPDKPLLRRISCKDDKDSPATPLVRCPNTKKYSRPVALSDFCHDYHQMIAHTHFGFSQEYESIQKVGKKLSWSAAVLPENVQKNRYSNILPYDRTRVKLSYIEGDEGSDYINASYIPGYTSPREFISCQGPLPGTIADMWRMIWELKISNVVMVTKLVERGKVRCDQYWPEDHKPVFFGDVIVTMTTKTETESCWHVREFMIQYGAKTRKVKHFHFLDWPDHGVPDTSSPLIKFITTVRLHIPDDNTPTLVHCSAGVGRTGTFICLDRLLQHIEEYDHADIMGIVCEMRFHRSFMVQTEQQYIFIHKCLLDILEERGLTAKRVSLTNGNLEHKV